MRTQLTGYLGMEFLCSYSRTVPFESYIFTSSQALVLYSQCYKPLRILESTRAFWIAEKINRHVT